MSTRGTRAKKIGVLAQQGAFSEHIALLRRLDAEAFPVRLAKELEGLDGLVIPGGESSTIGKLMKEYDLTEPVRGLAKEGFPILGTCAGMILLAKRVSGLNLEPLGAMDIEVRRNAFGRQVDSFETDLEIPVIGGPPFRGVFIRAPFIERAGDGVEVLARLPNGMGVAARQGNMVALAFHPELTNDLRLHAYFLSIVHSGR
ncbi:MAG: pyridoxal 5'-phosphate synthase glutaminase subunit PdxT [Dehalococcoidia bacterium]